VKKLPDEALAVYLAQGAGRSHQAVATHFGVDKKTVTNRAMKENWKGRVAEHDRQRRAEAEKRAGESISAMDERHLKVAGYIQGRSIETLKSMPLDSAMDAVKAYKLAAEMERMIRGRPNEQSVADIEKRIWAEHEQFLVPVDSEPEEEEPDAMAPQMEPQAESPPPAEPEPMLEPQTPVVEEQVPEEDDE
jgi:hypothetical protein